DDGADEGAAKDAHGEKAHGSGGNCRCVTPRGRLREGWKPCFVSVAAAITASYIVRMQDVITTEALRKVYPAAGGRRRANAATRTPGASATAPVVPPRMTDDGIVALETLDLGVRAGEFFGLLGPNGAGKTTTIGILTTRVVPTSGRALVAGYDVTSAPHRVRQHIGVVPQRPNPDRALTALENLVFHAAYFGISLDRAHRHARELLER